MYWTIGVLHLGPVDVATHLAPDLAGLGVVTARKVRSPHVVTSSAAAVHVGGVTYVGMLLRMQHYRLWILPSMCTSTSTSTYTE